MSALKDAEKLLPSMSRAEKAKLMRWVAQDLADVYPGIESTPDVCGGAPRIVRTRIPVWLPEHARRVGSSDAEILSAYPTIREDDLEEAWAYVRTHKSEIDEQIRNNDENEEGV